MKHFLTVSEFSESIGTTSGPLLGIDWGSRKIGLSITDAARAFIFPLAILKNDVNESSIAKLVKIIQERRVVGIVIGNPTKLDGKDGINASAVQKFAADLLWSTGLPILFQDERFTSRLVHVARDHLKDKRTKRHNQEDDSASACYILQTAIATLKDGCHSML